MTASDSNGARANGASANGAVHDASAGIEPAGFVLGMEREASTPLDFWVHVDSERYLQLDDVVHVRSELPDGATVDAYGIVEEVRATHEGVRFASDVTLVNLGVLPAATAVAAHVSVTRIEPEIFVPPQPGRPVALAHGEVRERALLFDGMRLRDGTSTRFTAGMSRSGEAIYGNLQFLDGRRGAHVNISGISGVATKTSYAMFLLYSLFEGGGLTGAAANGRAIVFNVKGEDLLFLDRDNADLTDADRERYATLGLPARPFQSVAIFAPVRRGEAALPDTGSRMDGVTGFYWTVREFCERGYLRFLFADADDERSQLNSVVASVERALARVARDDASAGGVTVRIDGAETHSFEELVEMIDENTAPDTGLWQGRASPNTVAAFMRRLEAAVPHVGQLIRGRVDEDPAEHRIDWTREQLTVVAINNLPDRAQRFVVGVVLKTLMERREQQGIAAGAPPVFVVLDELNKYAPRDGYSPIKEVLLDIAERGRSLKVVLIGAQQTASEVEPRVVANCSFRVVGRLDAAEARRGEYGFLTPAARARASLLKPGTMIFSQPEIPVPLLVQFPHPAWATRASEARERDEAEVFRGFER